MLKKDRIEFYNQIQVNKNVNDKVFRDFIKFFESTNEIKLSLKTFNSLNEIVLKTATNNGHDFVRQSDLFSMLFCEINEIENFEEKFFEAAKNTMFKEMKHYMELNSEIKDLYVEKFEKKTLTIEEIHHAEKIVKWLKQTIAMLESSSFANVEQLENNITGEIVRDFFDKENKMIITIFKWQLLGFEMISNSKG